MTATAPPRRLPAPADRDGAWERSPAGLARRLNNQEWPLHLRLLSTLLVYWAAGRIRRMSVSLPPGHGKALTVDTPVPTPDGWTTMGALRPGDTVFDERGRQCKVTDAWEPYDAEVWRVRLSDGAELLADRDHQWVTTTWTSARRLTDRRRKTTMEANNTWPEDWATTARLSAVRTTGELAATLTEAHQIPVAGPLETPDVDLPVDPWVLGFWLGDGTSANGSITAGEQDQDHVLGRMRAAGFEVRKWGGPLCFGVYGLQAKLRAAGVLGDKHVPSVYLRAGVEQRLELLRGLMDSDGSFEAAARNRCRVSYCSQSKRLAFAALELVRSLGGKPTLLQYPAQLNGRRTGKTAYRVEWSTLFQPFSLQRKAGRVRLGGSQSRRNITRYVRSVEPTGVVARVRCIAVDSPSACFLAGDAMVPTHNSEAISRVFPVWDLNVWPKDKVVVASYAAELAVEHGKAARELAETHADRLRFRLKQDSQAANRWRTHRNGGMWTMGTGGSLTGRRANKLWVDDAFAGFKDSHSETERDAVWSWWRSVARTRLLPGSPAGICATRWHERDLIGMVKEQDPEGERWTHVVLPAVAEQTETIETVIGERAAWRLRRDGLVVPEWHREKGEALWPVLFDVETGQEQPWYDEAELAEVRSEVMEYFWASLYQQHPSPPEGEMFPVGAWEFVNAAPRGCHWVRRWDLAATKGGGDQTSGGLVGRDPQGRTYISDVVFDHLSSLEVKRLVRAKAHEDAERYGKKSVHTIVEQEGGSAGKSVGEDYVREVLAGFSAEAKPSTGSKEVRARPLSAQQQAGFVFVVRQQAPDGAYVAPSWWDHAREEFRAFPNGRNDDIVDVVSAAYLDLAMRRPSRARAKSAAGRSVAGGAMGSGASRIPSRAGRAR